MKPFNVGDILYTKDGRKSGNLACVHIQDLDGLQKVYFMSDYGNLVTFIETWVDLVRNQTFKHFYTKRGNMSPTHKYYDYYNKHPEMFI